MMVSPYHAPTFVVASLAVLFTLCPAHAADKPENTEQVSSAGSSSGKVVKKSNQTTDADSQVESSESIEASTTQQTNGEPNNESSVKSDVAPTESPKVDLLPPESERKTSKPPLKLRWGCALDEENSCQRLGRSEAPAEAASNSKSSKLPFDVMIGAGVGLSSLVHINTVGTPNVNFRGVSAFGPLMGVLDLAARIKDHQVGARIITGGLWNTRQVSAAVPVSVGVSLRYAYLFSRRSFRPYLGASFGYARLASALRISTDDFWTTRVHQSLQASLLPGLELGRVSGLSFYVEGDLGMIFSQNTAARFGGNLGARYAF